MLLAAAIQVRVTPSSVRVFGSGACFVHFSFRSLEAAAGSIYSQRGLLAQPQLQHAKPALEIKDGSVHDSLWYRALVACAHMYM